MNVFTITLICAVPMFILCYNLIIAGRIRPDYGTNHLPDPVIHGTIVIG